MTKAQVFKATLKTKQIPIDVTMHTRGGGVKFYEVRGVDERGVLIGDKRFLVGPKGYKVVRLPDGKRHLTLYEWLQAPPAGFYDGSWVEDPMASPEWAKASEDAKSMKDLITFDDVDWKDRILFIILGGFVGYTVATIAVPLLTRAGG